MEIKELDINDLKDIKDIYLEAFPKEERKPFFTIKYAIKKQKVRVFTAKDDNTLCGFIMCIPYKNLVLVDYLAVSSKIRSKGTGSMLVKYISDYYKDKTITLLIEKLDEKSHNYQMRIARKNFYIKNGFAPTNLFINGVSGEMEILSYHGAIDRDDFLEIMEYALGKTFFKLSKIAYVG